MKKINEFECQIKQLQTKVTRLKTEGGGDGTSAELLADLQTSLEELHVAEEELRNQNDQLVQAHQMIEAERHRYADLFNFAPDAYLVTSQGGTIREANAAAGELFSLKADLLAGKNLDAFFPSEDRVAFYKMLETLRTTGQVREWEVQIHPRVRPAFSAAISAAVARDPRGEVTEVRWLIRDITQRKKNEAELTKYREHLEDLVAERTQELSQANENLERQVEETEQARRELEERVVERTMALRESNTDLEQFAYVASHDLQEPLRMVASFVGLLQEKYKDILDDEGREFMGFAIEGAQRMQNLIRDLLKYSRVRTRGHDFEPTDSQAVFAVALKDLAIMIEETGAQVTHDPLPTLPADRTQLRQVFENLVINGIKFRRDNETPKVHVSARRVENFWEFSVRDNGIGIDPRHQERIFLIFQRLHTRGKYAGTGMGLAIVKRIIERHGGRVWVQSTPGEGSTFYFTLPAGTS